MGAIPPPPGVTLLPLALQGLACESCAAPTARWSLGPLTAPRPVCSVCLMYRSPWGVEYASALEVLLLHREQATGVPLARDAEGHATSTEALDILLAAVVLPWVMEHRRQQCL